jgi:hypothetical protein
VASVGRAGPKAKSVPKLYVRVPGQATKAVEITADTVERPEGRGVIKLMKWWMAPTRVMVLFDVSVCCCRGCWRRMFEGKEISSVRQRKLVRESWLDKRGGGARPD